MQQPFDDRSPEGDWFQFLTERSTFCKSFVKLREQETFDFRTLHKLYTPHDGRLSVVEGWYSYFVSYFYTERYSCGICGRYSQSNKQWWQVCPFTLPNTAYKESWRYIEYRNNYYRKYIRNKILSLSSWLFDSRLRTATVVIDQRNKAEAVDNIYVGSRISLWRCYLHHVKTLARCSRQRPTLPIVSGWSTKVTIIYLYPFKVPNRRRKAYLWQFDCDHLTQLECFRYSLLWKRDI